jgi:hypothetical protein
LLQDVVEAREWMKKESSRCHFHELQARQLEEAGTEAKASLGISSRVS